MCYPFRGAKQFSWYHSFCGDSKKRKTLTKRVVLTHKAAAIAQRKMLVMRQKMEQSDG